jgi:hypothetical protein
MGHDISGYKNGEEIAYLRRGSFDTLNGTIYNALNCNNYNKVWAGSQEEIEFSKDQLLNGLSWLGDKEEFEPERAFLKDCLSNLDENDNVLIFFG